MLRVMVFMSILYSRGGQTAARDKLLCGPREPQANNILKKLINIEEM